MTSVGGGRARHCHYDFIETNQLRQVNPTAWPAVERTAPLNRLQAGVRPGTLERMIGERLGKWVIFKELGRGGMGRVYLAQEELTGKQAALKVLAAELALDPGFLQRFH